MTWTEYFEAQNEIIRAQSEIIDSLFSQLCQLCAADDISIWPEIDAMLDVARKRRETE